MLQKNLSGGGGLAAHGVISLMAKFPRKYAKKLYLKVQCYSVEGDILVKNRGEPYSSMIDGI